MEIAFAIMKLTATPGPLLMSGDTTITEQVLPQTYPGFVFRGFKDNKFAQISVRYGAFNVTHPDYRKFWVNELTKGQKFASILINASMWVDGHSEELEEIARHPRMLPDDTALMTVDQSFVRMKDKYGNWLGDFSSRPKDADGVEFGRPYADIQKAYDFCQQHGLNHRVAAGKNLVIRAGRFTTNDFTQPLTALFYSDTMNSHLEESTQSLGRTNGMVPVGTPPATNYCSDDLRQEVMNWNYTDLPQIAKAVNTKTDIDDVPVVGQYARDLTRHRLQGLLEYQLFNHTHRGKNYGAY
jgi:hypothetical protein